VTEEALRGYPDTGVERVVLELPTLNEGQTMAKLDDFTAVTRALGW
jgi:hypothetical protein